MYYTAQIDSNTNRVVSVTETTDPLVGSNFVSINSYDTELLGKVWNGEVFEAPPAVYVQISVITKLDFLRRFTSEERINIRSSTNAIVVDFLYLLDLAQDVNLADPDTVAGVNYCESLGLLSVGRALAILTPLTEER